MLPRARSCSLPAGPATGGPESPLWFRGSAELPGRSRSPAEAAPPRPAPPTFPLAAGTADGRCGPACSAAGSCWAGVSRPRVRPLRSEPLRSPPLPCREVSPAVWGQPPPRRPCPREQAGLRGRPPGGSPPLGGSAGPSRRSALLCSDLICCALLCSALPPQMPPKKAGDGVKAHPIIGRFGTSLKIGIVGLPNVG